MNIIPIRDLAERWITGNDTAGLRVGGPADSYGLIQKRQMLGEEIIALIEKELAVAAKNPPSPFEEDNGDLYCHYCNQKFPYHKVSCEARPTF